jgi:REP element-mobilizing transposase RayT
MPRRRREDAPGSIHHVWARGIEGRAIFHRDGDRLDLLDRMTEILVEAGACCLAWALMTNHLHLVVRTGSVPLSTVMRRIHTGFAVRFDLTYQRTGYLFQSRFGSRLVRDDDGLRTVIRYVLRNPLDGGLVRDLRALERFPWCGYGAILGLRPALPFEAVEETLSIFGSTTSAGRSALSAWMAQEDDVEPARGMDDFPRLVREVCREHRVLEDELHRGVRNRPVSSARSEICRRAVLELGMRPVDVARRLGLSESAVCQARQRRKPAVSEDGGPSPS